MRLRLRQHEYDDTDLLVMAIVNRTPDSFFDGGATFELSAAVDRALLAVSQGADIIDVGGVRAGMGPDVTTAEEIDRVVPVVAALRQQEAGVVISVDTYRADVAEAVLEVGADLINEPWGLADPRMVDVVARAEGALVCSHAGGLAPRTDPFRVEYADVVGDVVATCTRLADQAVEAGVRRDGIVIDPCHDFAKNTYHSLEITRRLEELVATGWPVLVSLSRKDFVGESLGLPKQERLTGTLAATVYSALQGARIFRAHDVAQTRQALDMVRIIRGDLAPKTTLRGLV